MVVTRIDDRPNAGVRPATAYLKRLQLFVAANSIADDKLVPKLLTIVGSEHYSLLRSNPVQGHTKGSWPLQVPAAAHLHPYYHRRNEPTVKEGCLLWGIRVVIPQKLHQRMLQKLHKDHPGVSR